MITKACFFAPATAANLSAGYEILGMALAQPGDIVTATRKQTAGVKLLSIIGDEGKLPLQADKNTATVAVQALLNHCDLNNDSNSGINLELTKQLPLYSGMGSSSASAAAAVAAVNHLLQLGLTSEELVPFAMEGERVACGSAHADNVAPALMGGIILIRSYQPLDLIRLPIPQNLYYSVVSPDLEISTQQARELVPDQVSMRAATEQMGNIAAFVAGLCSNDLKLMGRGLEDWLAEPFRAKLIPGFSLVKQAALDAGALGAGLSGSGPSMFALSSSMESAKQCAEQMQLIFSGQSIESQIYFDKVNKTGTRLISAE